MLISRRRCIETMAAASGALLLPAAGERVARAVGEAEASGAQAGGLGTLTVQAASPRERLLADFGWQFYLGHAADPAKDFGYGRSDGAFAKSNSFIGGRGSVTQATFDTSGWTSIDLPHDWAVELPFVDDRNLIGHGCKPLGRAYPETSIGWYRRTFDIPAGDLGRRIALEFEGVFRDAIVILNNHFVGRNLSGYAPFRFDVTDLINYGGMNVLVVRADATEGEGWFYEGAGIYRHVWLEKTAPLHIAPDGVFVTTRLTPGGDAICDVRCEIVNDSGEPVRYFVGHTLGGAPTDNSGAARAEPEGGEIAPWSTVTHVSRTEIAKPRLWSIESPHLYELSTTLQTGSPSGVLDVAAKARVVDTVATTFGVRTIRFDANQGFFLNGTRVEIQGMCNHQDHAGVGSALPDRLQAFRVAKLKDMGVNAYRTSHNPPTPALLDACDRLGMLVLDETRMMSSNEEGLSEFTRMIRRDRNHPCVFCWSIGNEEGDQGTDRGARIADTMKRVARELDPTRLVTEAMNGSWGKGLTSVVDVQGFNYGHAKELDDFRAQFPTHLAMGTEVASTVSTRGIYANDPDKGYVSAYDRNFPPWASTAEEWWTTYAARPWIAGGFVWTGFDYRGEPTPYGWPCINSHFGILDTCGFPKDLFYYYRAWWGGADVLHLFPHWNWTGKQGEEIEVWCFTNLERVELFVNGASAGAQDVARNSHASWKVPYAPGAIEARGFRGGTQMLTDRRETTGAPAGIALLPDRARVNADGEDVSVVTVQIVDAQGRVVPTAGNDVAFTLAGPGRLIGVGNGDPSSHEPDHAPKRSAFNGLCMAIVQASKTAGEIRIDAASPGLTSASAAITVAPATPRASL
ncbi:MAG TPA: beta-galactosidase GalA [Vicinamibacterales bacterium]